MNKKHHAKYLPELQEGQRVWVKSPHDKGAEGIVIKKDENPQSYWVRVGNSVLQEKYETFGRESGRGPKTDSTWI